MTDRRLASTPGARSGGTAGDPPDGPDLPITSVVIDPQTDLNSIIISSDLGVLRTLDNGATWQRLGLGLPNVNVTSLSLDFTVTPSLLRAATYGRSAFELTAATGPLLGVDCDLGFGVVAVGTAATRECSLFNVGSEDLHVTGFIRASGSLEFSISSGPATPVTIPPGEHVDYTIRFAPTNSATTGDVPVSPATTSSSPSRRSRPAAPVLPETFWSVRRIWSTAASRSTTARPYTTRR